MPVDRDTFFEAHGNFAKHVLCMPVMRLVIRKNEQGSGILIKDVKVRDAVPAKEGLGHGLVEPHEEPQASLADSTPWYISNLLKI